MSQMFADDRPAKTGRWGRLGGLSVAERLADEGLLPDESRDLLPEFSGHRSPMGETAEFMTVRELASLLLAKGKAENDRPPTRREDCEDSDVRDALKSNLLKGGTHQIDESHEKAFVRVLHGMRLDCQETGGTNVMRTAVHAACHLETKLGDDGATLTKVFRDNGHHASQMVSALGELRIRESELVTLPSRRDVSLLKGIFSNLHGEPDRQYGATDSARSQESGRADLSPQVRQLQMS